MEFFEKFIYFIAAVVCILILISITWNFLKAQYSQEKIKIFGNKRIVISQITNLIYKCFDENKDKKISIICFRATFESDQEISSLNVLNNINPSRINTKNVIVDNLGLSGKIIIRYENQFIYVKKVESEGTSS